MTLASQGEVCCSQRYGLAGRKVRELCLVGKRGQLRVLISELTAISYFMILVLIVAHNMEMWPVWVLVLAIYKYIIVRCLIWLHYWNNWWLWFLMFFVRAWLLICSFPWTVICLMLRWGIIVSLIWCLIVMLSMCMYAGTGIIVLSYCFKCWDDDDDCEHESVQWKKSSGGFDLHYKMNKSNNYFQKDAHVLSTFFWSSQSLNQTTTDLKHWQKVGFFCADSV